MLKNKRNITVFFITVLWIISLTNITAFAEALPDLDVRGTITISMKKDGKAVPGGEFEMYQIADISLSDGKSKYAFTKDFKACKLSLNHMDSDKFASGLERYIKNNKISGVKKSVDQDGIAKFSNLKTGVYFVMQSKAAKGYSKANSFTVLLPASEDGEYNYHIQANPKFDFSSSESTTMQTTVKPSEPTDTRLPKTGQMNLPVPILTASGICMFVLGLIMRSSGRKEGNEE